MAKFPSLVYLCMEAIKGQLVRGDELISDIYELPPDLFDTLITKLPPLALHKLQTEMPFKNWNDYDSKDDCLEHGRKRGRSLNFDKAWKALFKSRWPELVTCVQPDDWRQMYWQTHLQNCFDEAAELALLPSFDGCLGELKISDNIMRFVGSEGSLTSSILSKLSYHCQEFGHCARCLRLQNVLCVGETCQLLRKAKLQSLVLRWIRSKEHVEGLCKLLIQNSETLMSLEFIHCNISSAYFNAMRGSLCVDSNQTHGIQHFSVRTSSFVETSPVSLPPGLMSFLSNGRYLCSLNLCDNNLDRNFAQMLFRILIDASHGLSTLDLSENNIAGWLSDFNLRSSNRLQSSSGLGKSLQSLRVLNVRGNNLHKEDAESLMYASGLMPNLEILDMSDNPIEDDGIRCLIPHFIEAPERCFPLTELKVENCELSCNGVAQLLDTLSTSKRPLNSLSLADNDLGSQVAGALARLLGTIKTLNIGGIGLGSAGFHELQKGMTAELKLVEINISKNRGGFETARFLSKLISLAPQLTAFNAAYNLMPVESLSVIGSAIKHTKGKLERLDLTGNPFDHKSNHELLLAEFQSNGKPILVFPSSRALYVPYDDDP